MDKSAGSVYREIKECLGKNGITAPVEARVIFEAVFGYDYAKAECRGTVPEEEYEKLKTVLKRRIEGYPLQYIASLWPFLDFEVSVGEGVLIPRPETESAALACVELLREMKSGSLSAVDLCSGTGCIAVAIKRACPEVSVTAVEWFEEAFAYLKKNIALGGVDVRPVRADVFGFEDRLEDSSVDLLCANPPYVSAAEYGLLEKELCYEPKTALTDGADGLCFYRYIADRYFKKIRPNGNIVFEIGGGRERETAEIVRAAGFADTGLLNDIFGNPRVLVAKRP